MRETVQQSVNGFFGSQHREPFNRPVASFFIAVVDVGPQLRENHIGLHAAITQCAEAPQGPGTIRRIIVKLLHERCNRFGRLAEIVRGQIDFQARRANPKVVRVQGIVYGIE